MIWRGRAACSSTPSPSRCIWSTGSSITKPNFFEALARYNSYEMLGIWVGPDWQLASLVPWDPMLLEYLALSAKTTHLLVVGAAEDVRQGFLRAVSRRCTRTWCRTRVRGRYAMIVDGEVMDAKAGQAPDD